MKPPHHPESHKPNRSIQKTRRSSGDRDAFPPDAACLRAGGVRHGSHHAARLPLMNGADPPSCLCQRDVGLTRGGASQAGDIETDEGSGCVAGSVSSGSPSPTCAPPTPALHSNLMIMIFAQDDLCLHSVITPPAFYDLSYWKSMGHKSAPSELIIITTRFSLQRHQI